MIKRMLKIASLVVLAGLLLVTGCSQPAPQGGAVAPDFRLQDLDGQWVTLSALKGKPIMLNFWATWCGPCRAEMPFIQEIYREWSSKGLIVFAIDIGESRATVKGYLEANNLSLPVLLDGAQDTANQYSIAAIPTTFFIDRSGIIRQKITGAFPNKKAIENELSRIMP